MGLANGEVHRTNHRLYEGGLGVRDAVLLVERFIGPQAIPVLHGDPLVHRAEDVLRGLTQRDQKTRKSRSKIRFNALRGALGSERSGDKVRLGAYRTGFAN